MTKSGHVLEGGGSARRAAEGAKAKRSRVIAVVFTATYSACERRTSRFGRQAYQPSAYRQGDDKGDDDEEWKIPGDHLAAVLHGYRGFGELVRAQPADALEPVGGAIADTAAGAQAL